MSGVETKLSVAAVLVPVVTAYDIQWGLCLALGLLAGWFARAGKTYELTRSWREVGSRALVWAMMGGGSLIATLVFARLADADTLGVAGIAFGVAFRGDWALGLLVEYLWQPFVGALRGGGRMGGE